MYPNLFKTKEKEGGDRVEGSSFEKDGRCCPEGSSALEPAAGRRRATEWAASATALHVEIEQTTTRHGRSVLQRTVRRNGVAWVRVDDTSGLFGPLVARSVPPSSVLARSKRQPVRSMKYGPKNLRSGPVKARSARSDRRRSTSRSCSRGHRPPPRDLLVPFFLLFSREKMERTTETGLSHNHGAISRLLVVTPMEITAHMILRKSLPLFSSI